MSVFIVCYISSIFILCKRFSDLESLQFEVLDNIMKSYDVIGFKMNEDFHGIWYFEIILESTYIVHLEIFPTVLKWNNFSLKFMYKKLKTFSEKDFILV